MKLFRAALKLFSLLTPKEKRKIPGDEGMSAVSWTVAVKLADEPTFPEPTLLAHGVLHLSDTHDAEGVPYAYLIVPVMLGPANDVYKMTGHYKVCLEFVWKGPHTVRITLHNLKVVRQGLSFSTVDGHVVTGVKDVVFHVPINDLNRAVVKHEFVGKRTPWGICI